LRRSGDWRREDAAGKDAGSLDELPTAALHVCLQAEMSRGIVRCHITTVKTASGASRCRHQTHSAARQRSLYLPAMVWMLAAVHALIAASALAQGETTGARTVWDGVYTSEQAVRGEQTYKKACSYCHRDNLQGDEGPPLAGSRFTFQWLDRSVADLLRSVEATMPDDAPGTLPRQAYVDVIGYLLKANDYPAGAAELPVDDDRLKQIVFTEKRPGSRP
jgi:mono/diheme cytochrome c family protein